MSFIASDGLEYETLADRLCSRPSKNSQHNRWVWSVKHSQEIQRIYNDMVRATLMCANTLAEQQHALDRL